jgi:predicted ATPase
MMLGYPDRATACMRDCLRDAREIAHPLTVAMAYNFGASVFHFLRDRQAVQEIEEVRVEYATKHDFELFLLLGEIYRGWLIAEDGRAEEGLAHIQQGLMMFQAIGAELGRPTFLSIQADVLARLGRFEEALGVVTDAIALGESTGLHYWDAELRRLRGEFLLETADSSDAEACFLEAIEIARRQKGKLHELRAATSLARLWKEQGKTSKARALLSEIYGWFSEGFGTADLTDAKALLADLAATRRSR